jgi:hypothetical protein
MRRKNRERTVFVSYQYNKGNNSFGFGNSFQFYTNKKCDFIPQNDLREMESVIKEQGGFSSVVILNYKVVG